MIKKERKKGKKKKQKKTREFNHVEVFHISP